MFMDRLKGRKVIVMHAGAATQLMHLAPVLEELLKRNSVARLSIFFLTAISETEEVEGYLAELDPGIPVRSEQAARFILFSDMFLTVDQGMIFPYFGCETRACCFHGQPSKGNVYQRFNYRQINTLFFYGPLMRDHYLEARAGNPNWPVIECHNVGQPLSDARLSNRHPKEVAREKLGLDPSRFTVVYAPSFEYCSSFAMFGTQIIKSLLDLDVNLIVKPHPAFYNAGRFQDEFNKNIPNVKDWRRHLDEYASHPKCVFPDKNNLDAVAALSASDVMLTDFSGIAFDGILLDMGMIYWECQLLFSEYLPKRYGIDGEHAKRDLACNVGRDCGLVVCNTVELAEAVSAYRKFPGYKHAERNMMRDQLLFNPGTATTAMAGKIEEILGVRENDR